MRKKLYLVKYEVIATNLARALKSKGEVYEVQLAEEKMWPKEEKKMGFSKSREVVK